MMLGGFSLMSARKPYWSGSEIPGEITTPSQLSGSARNILVAALAERDGAALAEMAVLINVDLESGDIGAMYIPGETLVGENAVRYGRLSGAFNWGTENVPEGGAAALAECVSTAFMIPVDNYLVFDIKLIPDLTDRLGGVRATLGQDVALDDGTVLEKGDHIFGADEVRRYVIPDGGLDPAAQNIIRSGFMEGLVRAALGMPSREAVSVAKGIKNGLDTDISLRDHWKLSKSVFGKSSSHIEYFLLPGISVTDYGSSRLTVWSVRCTEAAALINERLRAHTEHVLAEDMSVPEITA